MSRTKRTKATKHETPSKEKTGGKVTTLQEILSTELERGNSFLTATEIIAILNVSPHKVLNAIRRNKLDGVKIIKWNNRVVFYNVAHLMKWFQKRGFLKLWGVEQ